MIIFTGPPGSGKSTQAELLAKYLNCPRLSVGEELRKLSVDEQGKEMLASGDLVASSTVVNLVEAFLSHQKFEDEVIIDGSLRKPDEAIWLVGAVNTGRVRLTAVVNLDLSDSDVKKRLLPRGRKDDEPETIERRLSLFHQNQELILNLLRKNELPIINISADGDEDEIFEKVKKALEL